MGVPVKTPSGSHGVIPRTFSLDCVAKLKHDHFYSGLPKQLNAMVACLKASTNEKTYSEYLWAAREGKKEEAMEPLCNWTVDNQNKPEAMSFLPLQNLKVNQPIKNAAVQVVHLEQEDANKEDSAESDDPNGIEGVMEEFIVHLAWAVKEAQQDEKCC